MASGKTNWEADRPGGGSRGRLPSEWNPADHATYCPQHNPPPEDGGGSSWLCDCSGPLYELRAAARAVIDAEYGSNTWVEAFDVLVDVVAEQERLEVAAEDRAVAAIAAMNLDGLVRFRDAIHAMMNELGVPGPDYPANVANAYSIGLEALSGVAAEDRAGEVAFRGEEHVARLEAEANRG